MATKKAVVLRGNYLGFVYAVITIALGILIFIFSPYEISTQFRIRMISGFISYKWWWKPPVVVMVNMYFFNVTNADAFIDGTDSKIKVVEVGPVTYRETLTHKNPVFNENSTFSYTSKRELIYIPEDNAVDLLNATLIMPNLAALVVPSFISNAPSFVKWGMNVMMRKYKTQLLKKTTVYNYLWNSTDPIVDASFTIAPGIFPVNNVGIMTVVYSSLETNATVYIAPKYDRTKFFQIDKYAGSEYLPKRENQCNEKIVGAADDVTYHLEVTKKDTLRYYSRGLCTMTKYEYVRDTTSYGMSTYRFEVPKTLFNRTFPEEEDCYKGSPTLPDGVIDCGPCYFGTSVTASFPHFLYADKLQNGVEGMKPDQGKHESYVIVEPNTGVPLEGATRLQINIAMRDMEGFTPQLQRFSNLHIPLCWMEFTGGTYPWTVITIMYLHVVVSPILQAILSCLLTMTGLYLTYWNLCRRRVNMTEDRSILKEYETFLKANNKSTDYHDTT